MFETQNHHVSRKDLERVNVKRYGRTAVGKHVLHTDIAIHDTWVCICSTEVCYGCEIQAAGCVEVEPCPGKSVRLGQTSSD